MALDNLRILGLEVENVMRISVVKVEPKAGLVEVAGENRQGKSSLLNSIEMAISGGRSIPWKPIRTGEERASIKVALGNESGLKLRLTRTFRATTEEGGPTYTTALKIENEDGSVPKGAQSLLNSLMDGLTFDPEAFTREDPDKQAKILKGLVPGFDFAAAEKRRKNAYDARTLAGRQAKQLKAAADQIDVPTGTPSKRVDVTAITEQIRAAEQKVREFETELRRRADIMQGIEDLRMDAEDGKARAEAHRAEAARLFKEADREDKLAADAVKEAAKHEDAFKALPAIPEPPSAQALYDQVAQADATNRKVDLLQRRIDADTKAKAAAAEVDQHAKAITAIDKEMADALAKADLPVSGLTIELQADNTSMVMLRGVPFAQASTAEQLRTSMAIGMAVNPKLKVIRLKQGAMIDEEGWAVLKEVAEEEGYQIWAEVIKPHGDDAIIMEDGQVKGD